MPGSDNPHLAARIEVATWALIFGGLAIASLGLFVGRELGGATLAGTMIVAGLLAVAVGIVLIVVRSRMGDDPSPKAKP